MRRKATHWKRTLAAAVVLLLAPTGAAAQSKTGTTVGQFVLIEPGARFAGMGNAGVAISSGIQSVYYNPATAGLLTRNEVQFTHGAWLADISYDYAALGVPVKGVGNFFASVTSLNSGEIDVRTVEQPLGTGDRYTAEDLAIGVGYGIRLTDRFTVGAQVNYIEETIWHSSMRTWTVNLGTLYEVTSLGLNIGASLANFGTEAAFGGRDLRIQYDNDPDRYGDNSALPAEQYTEDYPVPVLFRVGVTVPRELGENSRMLFAMDAAHPNDNSESVSLGAEWLFRNTVSFRGGYQDLFQEDSETGLTFGVGLQGNRNDGGFSCDYAWADHGRLESVHRVTFVAGF